MKISKIKIERLHLQTKIELEGLENILKLSEELGNKEIKSLEEKYTASEDYPDHEIDSDSEKYSWLKDSLPFEVRNGLVCTIQSFLEGKLSEICEYVREIRQAQLGLFDLSGPSIRKQLKYINAYGYPDVEYNKTYKTLRKYVAVRNAIIHNGGNLDALKPHDKTEMEKIIKRNSSLLSINEYKSIKIESQFVLEFYDEAKTVLHNVFGAVKSNNTLRVV